MSKITCIREVSDLHLDADLMNFHKTRLLDSSFTARAAPDLCWMPPPLDKDSETLLIIAGDIWTSEKIVTAKDSNDLVWIQKIAVQFAEVVIVLGNHDYWGGNIRNEVSKLRAGFEALGLKNVHLLENNTIIIDDIKVVGATLWTDFNKKTFSVLNAAPRVMNDYSRIKTNHNGCYFDVPAIDIYNIHVKSERYIFENAFKDYPEQKLIVVTHMAPSEQSVNEQYQRPECWQTNYLYYTELGNKIAYTEIDYWFHGHMHDAVTYKIHNTVVACNPRGYAFYGESTGFDPYFRIDL